MMANVWNEKEIGSNFCYEGKQLEMTGSLILANMYLCYVLDSWFDVMVKGQCKGECYLIWVL